MRHFRKLIVLLVLFFAFPAYAEDTQAARLSPAMMGSVPTGGYTLVYESTDNDTTRTVFALADAKFQAFGFTAGGSWAVTKLSVYANKWGNPSAYTYSVSIYHDDGSNYPDETDILATGTLAGSSLPAVTGWVEVVLASAASLTNAQKYHVVITRDGSADATNSMEVRYYGAGGTFYQCKSADGAAWTANDFTTTTPLRLYTGTP